MSYSFTPSNSPESTTVLCLMTHRLCGTAWFFLHFLYQCLITFSLYLSNICCYIYSTVTIPQWAWIFHDIFGHNCGIIYNNPYRIAFNAANLIHQNNVVTRKYVFNNFFYRFSPYIRRYSVHDYIVSRDSSDILHIHHKIYTFVVVSNCTPVLLWQPALIWEHAWALHSDTWYCVTWHSSAWSVT